MIQDTIKKYICLGLLCVTQLCIAFADISTFLPWDNFILSTLQISHREYSPNILL